MKTALYLTISILLCAFINHDTMATENFTAQRFTQTATITLHAPIEKVFPLFGAFEEKKWADGWNPVLVYPSTEQVQEGLTFKTPGHLHGEAENTWVVTKYDTGAHLIQYFIIAPNRFLTITVQCHTLLDGLTSADVTYSFTGLTDEGNEASKHILSRMYEHNLADWQEAIDHYLKTGQTLKAHG